MFNKIFRKKENKKRTAKSVLTVQRKNDNIIEFNCLAVKSTLQYCVDREKALSAMLLSLSLK